MACLPCLLPRRLAATAAAVAATCALALPLYAQSPASAAPTGAAPAATAPATPATAAPDAERGRLQEYRQQRRAQHLADFKARLQLTPAQQGAWDTFTAAMRPGGQRARLDSGGMEQLTTPERIDRMRALRAQRSAEADRRGEAAKAFYAALTPEQQKTFDVQTRTMYRMGERFGRGEGQGGYGAQGRGPGMRGMGYHPFYAGPRCGQPERGAVAPSVPAPAAPAPAAPAPAQ